MKVAALRRQIFGIDVLRFGAALLVVCYHFTFWDFGQGPPILTQAGLAMPAFGTWLHFGWVGVEIFFVISGYVIAFSAHGTDSNAFLRSRVLRLVPGAWVCATAALLLFTLVLQRAPSSVLPGYISSMVFWPFAAIDPVYWTLGIEISFYALVYGLIRFKRLHLLEPITFVLGLGSGAFWIVALSLQAVLPTEGTAGFLRFLVLKAEGNRYLQLCLVQHACLFAIGVALYCGTTHGFTRARRYSLLALTAACLFEIVGQNGIIQRVGQLDLSPLPAMVAWLIFTALLLASVHYNDRVSRLLGRSKPFVRFAGRVTYPLYLVHDPVCYAVIFVMGPLVGQPALTLAICSAVVIAGLLEKYLERPVRQALSRLIAKTDRTEIPLQALR